jgi:Dyp-type peroxidase family
MGDALAPAYVLPGAQRYSTRAGRTSRREGRALIGFLDGTGNLRPGKEDADDRLVFVDPDNVGTYPPIPASGSGGYQDQAAQFPGDLRPPPTSEPRWTSGGSYLVVRGSVVNIGSWDDTALGEQENVIGRFKVSGASQDLTDDPGRVFEEPAFTASQANETVSVTSHARKANPRRPEDADRRLFRRGYPLIRATGSAVERGLLFVAFARSISTQFEFVVRAWMQNENFPRPGAGRDRLLQFDNRVLGGGYYFVPALSNKNKPWSWVLPAQQT